MIKGVLLILRSLVNTTLLVFHSKYKWLLIVFTIWLFRVDFLPANVGYAQILQILSVVIFFFIIYKEQPFIIKTTINTPIVSSATFFYSYALVSTLWSFLPSFSFFMAIQSLIFLFSAVWLFSLFHSFKNIEYALLMLMIGTMLYESLFFRLTSHFTFLIHHLPCASVAAMCFSYCFGEILSNKTDYLNRKKTLWGGVIISLFVLITSTSSGANTSAAFGMGVGLIFSGHLFWAILAISTCIFLYYNEDTMNELLLFIMPGKTRKIIETSNGRTVLWDYIFKLAKEKPLLGWGHASIERAVGSRFGFLAIDAHNSYYGIYGSLGIIGCVLAGFMIIRTYWELFINRINPGYVGLLSAFSCGTLNGYSYGFLSGKTVSITIIYMCIIVLSYYYANVENEGSTYE